MLGDKMTENNDGKAKGGHARAEKLSPERRSEIAKEAAAARWEKDVVIATHGSPDHPLKIGDLEIPCYVLADGRRVLHQRGMVTALGMSRGGSSKGGGDRLAHFVTGKALNSFISNDIQDVTTSPIKFKTTNGSLAYGYEAQILADICDAVLEARSLGKLQKQQLHIAKRCEILVRGFARVGIIALVDETTGYQRDRAKDALSSILEAFIAKELQPWVKTFPDEYYQELFRLRGLQYPSDTVQRPQYFGNLTNDIVYRRIAPGVLEELKRVVPKNDKGKAKTKLFQKLTDNIGYPKLREHMASTVTIMKLSIDYQDFISKLDRIHPRYNETRMLPFVYDAGRDSGKGI